MCGICPRVQCPSRRTGSTLSRCHSSYRISPFSMPILLRSPSSRSSPPSPCRRSPPTSYCFVLSSSSLDSDSVPPPPPGLLDRSLRSRSSVEDIGNRSSLLSWAPGPVHPRASPFGGAHTGLMLRRGLEELKPSDFFVRGQRPKRVWCLPGRVLGVVPLRRPGAMLAHYRARTRAGIKKLKFWGPFA